LDKELSEYLGLEVKYCEIGPLSTPQYGDVGYFRALVKKDIWLAVQFVIYKQDYLNFEKHKYSYFEQVKDALK